MKSIYFKKEPSLIRKLLFVLVNAIFIMCAVIALSLQQWQNFGYHEKEKAATGLEPVTAKPFLPNPYLDYFDKLELLTSSF